MIAPDIGFRQTYEAGINNYTVIIDTLGKTILKPKLKLNPQIPRKLSTSDNPPISDW